MFGSAQVSEQWEFNIFFQEGFNIELLAAKSWHGSEIHCDRNARFPIYLMVSSSPTFRFLAPSGIWCSYRREQLIQAHWDVLFLRTFLSGPPLGFGDVTACTGSHTCRLIENRNSLLLGDA